VASTGSRRHARTLVALCAAVAVGLVAVPDASYADPQSIDEVRAEVEKLDHEVVTVVEQVNVATEKLKAAEKQLRAIQDRIAAEQRSLDALQDEVGAYLVMAYRNAGVDETLQLLTSHDPRQFLERAITLDQLSAQGAEVLRRLRLAKQELDQTKLTAKQKLNEIDQVRRDLKAKEDEVRKKLRRANALLSRLTAEQRAALNPPSEEPPPTNVPVSGRAKLAVQFAYAQLGKPYAWGAAGPGSYDCSGLTMMAWRQAGVYLPHSSALQYGYGTHVSQSQLQPGDLVFFYSPISHVGIYIGGGKMIHSPRPGDVVKITTISASYMPYVGATRPG
jgi:cell wall-associated NlpC family hydrolase